jgi:hypothetical protein
MTGSIVQPALLVDLMLDEPLYLWTGVGDFEYEAQTYKGTGALGSISSADTDSSLAANGISLTLSGIPTDVLQFALSPNYRNKKVIIYIVLFDNNGQLIGGNRFYVGRIDVVNISKSGDENIITVNVENHLINFSRPFIRRYNEEDQHLFVDANDIGFEYVSKISGDIQFNWGNRSLTLRQRTFVPVGLPAGLSPGGSEGGPGGGGGGGLFGDFISPPFDPIFYNPPIEIVPSNMS